MTLSAVSRFPLGTSMHCAIFLMLSVVGTMGLSYADGQLRDLFGLLLQLAVIARFRWGSRHLAAAPRTVATAFGRRTARITYLLMYVIVGIQILRDLVGASPLHPDRCLSYLGYVIAAQLLIRLKTAAMFRFAAAA